jgi:hypothetical protein
MLKYIHTLRTFLLNLKTPPWEKGTERELIVMKHKQMSKISVQRMNLKVLNRKKRWMMMMATTMMMMMMRKVLTEYDV